MLRCPWSSAALARPACPEEQAWRPEEEAATVLADSATVHIDYIYGPSKGNMWPHVAIAGFLIKWKNRNSFQL